MASDFSRRLAFSQLANISISQRFDDATIRVGNGFDQGNGSHFFGPRASASKTAALKNIHNAVRIFCNLVLKNFRKFDFNSLLKQKDFEARLRLWPDFPLHASLTPCPRPLT